MFVCLYTIPQSGSTWILISSGTVLSVSPPLSTRCPQTFISVLQWLRSDFSERVGESWCGPDLLPVRPAALWPLSEQSNQDSCGCLNITKFWMWRWPVSSYSAMIMFLLFRFSLSGPVSITWTFLFPRPPDIMVSDNVLGDKCSHQVCLA